jgi:hypothetical protein
MKTHARRVSIDAEIAELLPDEPQLLAIADAVAATQREPRGRRRVLALAAVVALVGAAALGALAPWADDGGGAFLERALAAVTRGGPVLHAVVDESHPTTRIVSLSTGDAKVVPTRTEVWFDTERRVLRSRQTFRGNVFDRVWRPVKDVIPYPGAPEARDRIPEVDPVLAGFLTGYRKELEDGTAKIVGETTYEGRDVKVLEFHRHPAGPRSAYKWWVEAFIAKDDYRPLRYQMKTDDPAWPATLAERYHRVVEIEAIPRNPADFSAPPPEPPEAPDSLGARSSRELTAAEAARTLPQTPVWVGEKLAGDRAHIVLRDIAAIDNQNVVERAHAPVLRIEYGRRFTRAVIQQHASKVLTLGHRFPQEGSVALFGTPWYPGSRCMGELRRGRLYVTIDAKSCELAVEIARSLRPMS